MRGTVRVRVIGTAVVRVKEGCGGESSGAGVGHGDSGAWHSAGTGERHGAGVGERCDDGAVVGVALPRECWERRCLRGWGVERRCPQRGTSKVPRRGQHGKFTRHPHVSATRAADARKLSRSTLLEAGREGKREKQHSGCNNHEGGWMYYGWMIEKILIATVNAMNGVT